MNTDNAAAYLDYLKYEEASKREQLRQRLLSAQTDISDALRALDAGHAVNSSGILGSNAQRVDLLAAEYMQTAQIRGTFERAFKTEAVSS